MRDVVRKDNALMEATMRELALALADMKLRQSAERLGNLRLQEERLQGFARPVSIGP